MKSWVKPEMNELAIGETATFGTDCFGGWGKPSDPCKPQKPQQPSWEYYWEIIISIGGGCNGGGNGEEEFDDPS